MLTQQKIQNLVEERRATLGVDASVVEIPGFNDDCEGAFLLATPSEQRVLLVGDYKKEFESTAIAHGKIGMFGWHEIQANQFFDAKIHSAKTQIDQLKHLINAWQKLKDGRPT